MFVAHLRKPAHATQELRNLQKQQVLKDTPKRDSTIIDSKVDENEENKSEAEGGYPQHDSRLTRYCETYHGEE